MGKVLGFFFVVLGLKLGALCMLHMCLLLCYTPSPRGLVAGMGWKERCFSAVFNGKGTQNSAGKVAHHNNCGKSIFLSYRMKQFFEVMSEERSE